jgi:hypothetical protein
MRCSEKTRCEDGYQKSGSGQGFIEPFLPSLTKFNAVYVLKYEELAISSYNLNAEFQQSPQRGN